MVHIESLLHIIMWLNGKMDLETPSDLHSIQAAFRNEMLHFHGTVLVRLTCYCRLTFGMLCNDDVEDGMKLIKIKVLMDMAKSEFDLQRFGDNPSRGSTIRSSCWSGTRSSWGTSRRSQSSSPRRAARSSSSPPTRSP